MSERFSEFIESARLFSEPVVIKILETLYSKGESTATDVAKYLGIHIATATKYLEKLVEKGVVQKEEKRKHIRKTWVYSLAKKQVVLSLNLEILSLDEEKLSILANAIAQSYTNLFSQRLNANSKNPFELISSIKTRVGGTGAEVVFNHALKSLSNEVLAYVREKGIEKKIEEMIRCAE